MRDSLTTLVVLNTEAPSFIRGNQAEIFKFYVSVRRLAATSSCNRVNEIKLRVRVEFIRPLKTVSI